MDPQQKFKLNISTPKETLFQGEALSLSSSNSNGKFDILADHANFITLVDNHPINIVLPDSKTLHFQFNQAIVFNYQNSVSIYAEPSEG